MLSNYRDVLIIILTLVAIVSVIKYYVFPSVTVAKYVEPKYVEPHDILKTEELFTDIREEENIDKNIYDDSFLYSDDEQMDIIYGESRADETHCPGENQFDDDYDDDRPLWQITDEWNEKERFINEEIVSADFDGVYENGMYDINGKPYENGGCSDFASY